MKLKALRHAQNTYSDPSLMKINAKKHILSHQLTAQLHIENSKNKKVITLLQHIAQMSTAAKV